MTTAPGARHPRVSVFDFTKWPPRSSLILPDEPAGEGVAVVTAPRCRHADMGDDLYPASSAVAATKRALFLAIATCRTPTSIARSHVEGGQEAAPPERRDGNTEASAVMGDWG
jgi:hypothetical protein